MRNLFIVLMTCFVAACSGNGLRNQGLVMAEVQKRTNSVFVLRDTGYVGSAALIDVRLNGYSIGTIGNGETAIGISTPGGNTLDATFTGLASIGVSNPRIYFEREEGKNRFFLMSLQVGMFESILQMFEVPEATFISSLGR